MAVSRTLGRKAPTQNPVDFFECKQQGGTHGSPTKVSDVLKSGPVREAVMGRKILSKPQTK